VAVDQREGADLWNTLLLKHSKLIAIAKETAGSFKTRGSLF